MWRTLLTGYQYVLLVYFSSLNILYALFSCIGLRAIVVVFAREFSQGSLRDLLERDVYKPVSILVPAHNEALHRCGLTERAGLCNPEQVYCRYRESRGRQRSLGQGLD